MSDAMNPDQPPRPSSSESGQWKILAIVAPPAFLTMLCMAAGDPLIGLTPLLVVVGVPSAGIVAGRMLAALMARNSAPRFRFDALWSYEFSQFHALLRRMRSEQRIC